MQHFEERGVFILLMHALRQSNRILVSMERDPSETKKHEVIALHEMILRRCTEGDENAQMQIYSLY